MCFRIFRCMTDPPFTADLGGDPTARVSAERWRQAAADLRRAADEVGAIVDDVAAFHRPDVWQGAVASRFGDDLDHWRSRLGGELHGLGLRRELLALADRLQGQVCAVEREAGGVGASVGDDTFWWGRR